MPRVLSCLLFILAATVQPAAAQSLSGVSIGQTWPSVLQIIGLKPNITNTMGPFRISKWNFDDGNNLSITVSLNTNQVVYAESDWNGNPQHASFADFPGMIYGQTTLTDIRARLGSNGMAFSERSPVMKIKDGIANLNAYEAGDTVITFVTIISMKDFAKLRKGGDQADYAKLVSISISDPSYAASWGKPIKDPAYKKIEWK